MSNSDNGDHRGLTIPEIPIMSDAGIDDLKVLLMQYWENPQAQGMQLSMWKIAALLNRLDKEQEFNTGIKRLMN